ncbi:Clavaminate synthase-like protein [Canariomyces notabilis]|uniref:Clavaminate synthase-like protein n=1 Tax=Canariomyces notabilis TaxID=2074819 RepID=A0AAN6THZ3_9PEZI|nr:Clavaminate synthase-like protein [Canariomyces arenarius]
MATQGDSVSRSVETEWLDSHPMAWAPHDFSSPEEAQTKPSYVIDIGERGVAEVEEALGAIKERGFDGDAITRDNFPLPQLEAQLAQVCLDVHRGRGFSIVRGLDPQKYTAEDNVAIFLGIANYIGEQKGAQDKKGTMLTHVTQSKVWTTPPELRHGIHTTSGLTWHCDMGTDVLALHVRSLAEAGGNTYVASSWTIYKELAASYPEVLEALCHANWPIQVSGNPPRHVVAPLLHVTKDKIIISVDPGRLGLHPATAKTGRDHVPDLSPLQLEALQVLSDLASKHRLRLDIKPGDIVFINNLSLLHARDPYVDAKRGPGRHLVRLWLRNPALAWHIPKLMRVPWEAAFGPGGKGVPSQRDKVETKYPVLPTPEYKPPKYTAGSAAFILEDNDDVNGQGSA